MPHFHPPTKCLHSSETFSLKILGKISCSRPALNQCCLVVDSFQWVLILEAKVLDLKQCSLEVYFGLSPSRIWHWHLSANITQISLKSAIIRNKGVTKYVLWVFCHKVSGLPIFVQNRFRISRTIDAPTWLSQILSCFINNLLEQLWLTQTFQARNTTNLAFYSSQRPIYFMNSNSLSCIGW